jgi:hypothetical protein
MLFYSAKPISMKLLFFFLLPLSSFSQSFTITGIRSSAYVTPFLADSGKVCLEPGKVFLKGECYDVQGDGPERVTIGGGNQVTTWGYWQGDNLRFMLLHDRSGWFFHVRFKGVEYRLKQD